MELINNSLESNQNEDDQGPFLSSNVKDIFKRRKQEKNKKGMKKMNLKSFLPSEKEEKNNENNINNNEEDNEDDNEKIQMITENNISNEDNMKLEKKAKKNYKNIFNLHKNYDVNFNTTSIDINKNEKNTSLKFYFKETFFLILNIIGFIFFVLSFVKRSNNNDIIYYYLIYPISKTSFIYLVLNSLITSIILLLIKINFISIFHLLYSAIFYLIIFSKYHLSNNNPIPVNYFDPIDTFFFIYFIILIHILGIFAIIYYICNYFYLNGQLNRSESSLFGFLVDYWESERKIEKLEKYINLNLDQLITSKGYSHEENISNQKKNKRIILSIVFLGFILVSLHFFLMLKKNEIFNCDYLDIKENDIKKPYGYCYMKKLGGYFDVFSGLNNCTENSPDFNKKQFIKELTSDYNNQKISESTKYFAFPLTNNNGFYFTEIDNNRLEKKVNEEIFDLEKNKNDKIEVVLDSENKIPKLKIDLKYNEQLAQDRKNKENKDSLFDNVLLVHLSGVSQFYFKTALPKVYSFIESYNEKNKMSMESFIFGKYHVFNNDTFTNEFLMYYDSEINSINDIKNIINNNKDLNEHFKYFQDNGFITGQAIDSCKTSYSHHLQSQTSYWDHEFLSPYCTPNIQKSILSNNYCLYGSPFYSYQINYASQFWHKYKSSKKYFKLFFDSTNEISGSLLSYLDEPLYDFFVQLKFKGLLDRTAIFFVSDVGGMQKNIFYNFGKNSEIEMNIKFSNFMIVYDKKNNLNENEVKYLHGNKNNLLTPFDVYMSLVHIATGNKIKKVKLYLDEGKRGESVFNFIDKNDRNCELYNNWMGKDFCYFQK